MLKNTYLVTFLLVAIASQGVGQVTGKTAPASGNAKKSTPLAKKTIASKNEEIPAPVAVQDPILMTIGGDPVTQGEFESIYRKNNPKDAPNDRKALEEYLELFVNFKLKVKAAKDIGKDTAKAFINELKGYRRQLAQPYLTDKEVNEKLIDEAYQRMKKDVKASHILFKLPNDPLPKDTLLAFNKAITVRNRAMKGESFDALAKEFSDDPSAKQNGGDLGYFTSMMMVYPFESVAYETPVNEVSMPVRTKFGYHIIKVADIRDAQGQVHVAHIMVRIPENAKDSVVASSEKKIREIYEKVKAGEDFTQLASTYSDDRTSGKNGGVLPWFGPGKMVPEFEKVAFDLKNDNDISEPVKTQYGFHIIKRLERKGIQTFDEVKGDLKQKITKDSRSQVSRNAVISRVKKENNFTEDTKALDELITKVDTSYLNGKWSVEKAAGLSKKLFSIGNEVSSQADFAKYLADNQSKQNKDLVVEGIIRKTYEAYTTDKIIAFEDARLEQKYPEFRMLMQEYRDGILLFEITDENVWSKAIKDSSGLSAFHNENASKYMWNQRADAVIYKAKDAKLAKATRKLVAKRVKKGLTTDAIKKEINATSELNLQTEEALFSKGDNETIDKLPWVAGITADQIGTDGTVTFVEFKKILEPQPKSLQEAKGLITADYQTFLEQKWIKELKAKYKVDIDRAVFDTIH
jgi:peptidyl-prolyl cis-trans isomerase SurA